MKKCPYLKVECDSDTLYCEKCTLYIEIKSKECICGHNGITTISHINLPKNF